MLGINGAQGSGKSTLAAFLAEHLSAQHALRVCVLSLDDFYLSRAARAQLAASVHPLLITRGVPGTHQVQRGIDCLRALKAGQDCSLPRFSKATDDALGAEHEPHISERPDLVLFEGWCVGTPAQDAQALADPVNALERYEDTDGRWRRTVNQQLVGAYAEWFAQLDALVYLQVPGWAQVRQWRGQQERETAALHGGRSALLDNAQRAGERHLSRHQKGNEATVRRAPTSARRVAGRDRGRRTRERDATSRRPPCRAR